jgi:hypothetical protein
LPYQVVLRLGHFPWLRQQQQPPVMFMHAYAHFYFLGHFEESDLAENVLKLKIQ